MSDDTACAQRRMIGTNTGPLPGGRATGGSLDLTSADFFTYDAAADKVSSVVGDFDTATMLTQLGYLNGVFNTQGGSLDLSELGAQWL